jgi:hypothetical protein
MLPEAPASGRLQLTALRGGRGSASVAVVDHRVELPPATLQSGAAYGYALFNEAGAEIAAGEFCSQVTPRGKTATDSRRGTRHGINDYTGWFAGDKDMGGEYYGYDGPCPPWNDAIPHRYVFTLHALDIERCPVEGRFIGQEVRAAIAGHVLAQASLTGRYTLNPAVKL